MTIRYIITLLLVSLFLSSCIGQTNIDQSVPANSASPSPTLPGQGSGGTPPGESLAGNGAPQLYAVFAGNRPDWATNPEALTAIVDNFDAAEVMMDADSWVFGDESVIDYLEQHGVTVYSYVPAYFAWVEPPARANHAHAWSLRELVQDEWWLRDAAGRPVEPWPQHWLLNFAQPGLVASYGDFVVDEIDRPIRFDVLDTNLHYNGGHVDLDRNGIDDRQEHGLRWVDRQMAQGFAQVLERLRHPAIGNGSWMPAAEGEVSLFEDKLAGVMVEDFPAARWRDPETAAWRPEPFEAVEWHIHEALRRPGLTIFMPLRNPGQHAEWKRYIQDDWHAIRLALAAALLTDGYLGLGSPQMPGWCDECGVVNGITSRSPGAGNWLGEPMGPPESGAPGLEEQHLAGIWHRTFANGQVWLNATGEAAQMPVNCEWQKIAGWYDKDYNDGGCWDGVLPPYDARVLWRPPND